MKIHKCKFLLFLVALFLMGTILFVYSEEHPEHSANDSENKLTDGNQNPEEQSTKVEKSLETDSSNLKNVFSGEMTKMQGEIEILKAKSSNPTPLYTLIVGSVIFIASAATIFLGLRLRRELRTDLKSIRGTFQNRLEQNKQSYDNRLKFLSQRGEDNTNRIEKIESNHSGFQNTLSQIEKRTQTFELTLDNMKLNSPGNNAQDEIPQVEVQPPVEVQLQVEEIIQKTHAKVESLSQAYKNGEPIYYLDIENPTPSQNALLDLNWLARSIDNWKNELKESGDANQELIKTLDYANQIVKDKLMDVRKQAPPPLPMILNLDAESLTDEAIVKSNAYVSKYEGLLNGYQLQLKIDTEEYDQFIPQLIKDRLFMGVVRNIPFDQIPKQLEELLDFAGYKVVPIEIGRTEADSRLHDIQGSEQTSCKSGTIAKVILPGLQRIDNDDIVQQPSVIRAE